ncbi:MAG: DUF3793 family protein [Ruthenibacterium lactatiformans]
MPQPVFRQRPASARFVWLPSASCYHGLPPCIVAGKPAPAGTARFLQACGYPVSMGTGRLLDELSRRMRSAKAGGFPHEIGLFLGYPLEDVTGFIAAGGAEYRCSGCWKVYGDVEQAQHLFRRYAACRKRYLAMASSGLTLGEMLAAG